MDQFFSYKIFQYLLGVYIRICRIVDIFEDYSGLV